jgi:hypothetical protein
MKELKPGMIQEKIINFKENDDKKERMKLE